MGLIEPYKITLDFNSSKIKVLALKQYDKKSRYAIITCTSNNSPVKLDKTSYICNIKAIVPDDRPIYNTAEIQDDGTILVEFTETMLLKSGRGYLELNIISKDSESLLSTMKLELKIESSVYNNDRVIASEEFDALTKAITENTVQSGKLETLESNVEEAEKKRIENENGRIAAETKREKDCTEAISKTNDAVTRANEVILSASGALETVKQKASEVEVNANNAATSEENAKKYATSAENSATVASQKADMANSSASSAESYAVGETNSSKYYYEQVKNVSESLSGALRPLGTVTFEGLPLLDSVSSGDMYNVSDEFITTDKFKEGSGNIIPAGANIYKTADGFWDILAGTPVTGIKGNNETNYRRGNVNITAKNIGALATNGDTKSATTSFTSSDTSNGEATEWTDVNTLANGEKHSSIFKKISQMFKNIRYLYNMLGTTDISSIGNGTVRGAIKTINTNLGYANENITNCAQSAYENLIPYPYDNGTQTINGVTFTDNGDGTITANGTATADTMYYCQNVSSAFSLQTGTYTFSGTPDGSSTVGYSLAFCKVEYNIISSYTLFNDSVSSMRFPISNSDKIVIAIRICNGETVSNLVFKPMLELGTKAHEYKPYSLSRNGLNSQIVSQNNTIKQKAQTNHASTDTTYGTGNSSKFGHVKLSNTYTSLIGTAENSVGGSQSALYNAYRTLNNKFNNYLPLSGGTLTNSLNLASGKYIHGTLTNGTALDVIGLNSNNNLHIGNETTPTYIHGSGYQLDISGAYICPNISNKMSCGKSDKLFTTIYAKTGTINTSDRTKKHNISDLTEIYEKLFLKLQPKSFVFNDGDRVHIGAISQDVEDIMTELGIESKQFAGFCKDIRYKYTEFSEEDGTPIESSKVPCKDKNGNVIYDYALRYQEFIFLTIHMVQRLWKRVDIVEKENKKLTNTINNLETRLAKLELKTSEYDSE